MHVLIHGYDGVRSAAIYIYNKTETRYKLLSELEWISEYGD